MINATQNARNKSKPLRRARLFAKSLVLFTVIAGVAFFVVWRLSLPNLNQPIAMPELQARVDVYRDDNGIPHIFAASRDDAMRALGYVHASERFFQMEMNRRAGQGRLSEVIGKDTLKLDRLLRGLDLYRLAEKSIAALSPEARAALSAYCQGVNNWLEANRDRLPLEFLMLGIKPETWKPADSLVWGKLMALRLSANMAGELRRATLLTAQPMEIVERLYPPYPDYAPITDQPQFRRAGLAPLELLPVDILSGAAKTKAKPHRPLIPVLPPPPKKKPAPNEKQGFFNDPALQTAYASLVDFWPFKAQGASNEWVVAGTRSSTGMPILANDPHLDLDAPVLWYLTRITTPEITLTGATAPGLPVVLLGHNNRIAWGFTTTNSDVQDIFIETIDPKDPSQYLTPDGSEKFSTRTETIKIKGAPDFVMTVRGTRHGPIISDFDDQAAKLLTTKGFALALSFTGLSDKDTTPEALFRMNAAHDWNEFQSALQLYQSPPQNVFYADARGHIGYIAPGLVPVRKEFNGRFPVPGADGRYDWSGTVPFSHVPQLYDPEGGAILNANNAATKPGIYWFGREWDAPYRAQRIKDMLNVKNRFRPSDMQAMQMDTVSLAAKEILPFMLKINFGHEKLPVLEQQKNEALALLRHWDFKMDAERPEPLIFEWWLMRLHDALVRPPFAKVGEYVGPYNALVVSSIIQNPRGWCDVVLTIKSPDCIPQISGSFRKTLRELAERYGDDVNQWRWGNEHFAPLENKVLHHLPLFDRLLGLKTASGGGQYTVNRGGNGGLDGEKHPLAKTHGAGFRGIYDLSDLDSSRFIIATGESSHPLSSFYDNLLPLWNSGNYIEIRGTQTELAAKHKAHFVLLPERIR